MPPQPFNVQGHAHSCSWAHGGCAVDPASLLLAVALLRLVVVPCLNAHKRHVRDPLYFFNSLLVLRDEATIVAKRAHIEHEAYRADIRLDVQRLEFPPENARNPETIRTLMRPQHIHAARFHRRGHIPRIERGVFGSSDYIVEVHIRQF